MGGRPRRASLNARLLLIVVAAIMPVLAVATYNAFELQRGREAEAISALDRNLVSLSGQQSLLTENTRLLLSTISKTDIARHPDPDALGALFKDVLRENPLYVALLAFSPDGQVIAANAKTGPIDITDRPYYQQLVSSLDFTVGEYAISRSTGKETIHFAYPVLWPGTGRLVAILVASYDLDYYGTLFNAWSLPPGIAIEVFDRHGVRLFSYPEGSGGAIGSSGGKGVAALIEGKPAASGIVTGTDGSGIVASLTLNLDSSPEPDILMLMRYPRRLLTDATGDAMLRSALMILTSLVLSYILLRILSYYGINAQLNSLVAASRRFGAGDFSKLSRLGSGSEELLELSESLDEMALAIENRKRERDEAERALMASLAEKDVLLKEIHHRVKNNFQIISSLLNLQAGAINSPEATEAFRESQNRIKSMALIHEKLYQSESLGEIDFSDYVLSMAEEISSAFYAQMDRVRIETELERIDLPIDSAIPLGLILNEFLTNAFKYAFPGERRGKVLVGLRRAEGGRILLSVRDDGVGLAPGAQGRKGLGMELVSALAAQLRGRLEIKGEGGTSCLVDFPGGGLA